jgi:hypothetical protein
MSDDAFPADGEEQPPARQDTGERPVPDDRQPATDAHAAAAPPAGGPGGPDVPEPGEAPVAPPAGEPPRDTAGGLAWPAEPAPADAVGADWGELSDCFLTIWLRPRETVRRIVATDPRYWVLALASLGGGSSVLNDARAFDMGNHLSLASILVTSLIVGPLAGVLTLYVGAWAVRVLGAWLLDGQGRPAELRAALAWAHVPNVALLPLMLLASAAIPGLFRGGAAQPGAVAAAVLLLSLVGFVTNIWSLVIASQGVAEVQGFASGWKGLLNLILPGLVLLAAALVVGLAAALLVALIR